MKPRPPYLRLRLALVAALLIAPVAPAWSWSEETHQTTGAIAWADLKSRDPQALAALLALAPSHPHYPLFAQAAANLSGDMRERALFEWLSRWPDDIRTSAYDQPKWHYELRVVYGRTSLWPFTNGTASEGFFVNYGLLADACAAPASRAIAIGWLIHIVGDIQQPLHAGHQLTSAFNMTDRAGELAFVRREAGAEPTNLHQYWDKMMERSGVALPPGEADWANALATMWPRARLPELSRAGEPAILFASYLDETATLARLVAYQGTYLSASAVPAAAPVVSLTENRIALALAERRIATSGYRIADMLGRATQSAAAAQNSCPR